MYKFIKKNKQKKFIFLEVPLLIESKLMKLFDIIFFIKAKKRIRLQRFLSKGGKKEIFNILNKKQLGDNVKMKYSDHVIVNEKKFSVLKKLLIYLKNMSEIFLDTETTGLSFKDGHKIVEIACIETNDLISTGRVFHKLINQKICARRSF